MERAGNGDEPRRPARASARVLNAATRARRLETALSRVHARLYERTGGRFLPRWLGAPVLVLETVGRRSGQPRRTPVIYLRDGERYVVVAANAGSEWTPAWWLNLRAAGRGTIVLGGRRVAVRAREAEGEERERLWRDFVAASGWVADYGSFTGRQFPVVVLEPDPERPAADGARPGASRG